MKKFGFTFTSSQTDLLPRCYPNGGLKIVSVVVHCGGGPTNPGLPLLSIPPL